MALVHPEEERERVSVLVLHNLRPLDVGVRPDAAVRQVHVGSVCDGDAVRVSETETARRLEEASLSYGCRW